MIVKWIQSAILGMAVLVGGAALPAYGALFLGCPADAACNGNSYNWAASGTTGNVIITMNILTTNFIPADLKSLALGAVEIGEFTSGTWTATSFVAKVDGVISGIPFTQGGSLGANGCGNGNPGGKYCEETTNTNPLTFTRGQTLTFLFGFNTTGTVSTTAIHFKNQFLDRANANASWDKVGSLLSENINKRGGTGVNENAVPEPSTYAMIGSAMVAIAMLRRRKS